MCGICGIVGVHGLPREAVEWVRKMSGTLRHRGPDDHGLFVDPLAVLAARRLKIVDLEGGRQPVTNEDGTVRVVFNGEVYNHCEQRARLEKKGHRFRTGCDSEVVVHAYEEYGDECPRHLAGMFAFAVWDSSRRRLFIARDRMGQKPLYYSLIGDFFVFASELKALMQVPGFRTELDETSLHHYLSLQYVPEPRSIYHATRRLPAAHVLSLQGGQLQERRYWDLGFEPKLEIDEADATTEVRRLLRRAVRRRMQGDVPVGAFLSGGIDSSVIVALMAEEGPGAPRTFSLGFSEENLNELPYARLVADRFGTEHEEIRLEIDRFVEIFPDFVQALDEPFADPSALLTFLLARETRRSVTVALNGDGGDECFGGYGRYWLDRLFGWYGRLPDWLTQKVVPALVEPLPEPRKVAIESNWVLGLKRLAQFSRVSPKASILRWGSFFDEDEKARLYEPELRHRLRGECTVRLLAATFDDSLASDFFDRTLAVDSKTYLPGDLLVKSDRMTMAHSLEARSPFLDHDLVDFVSRLPVHFKLRGRTGKYLLRRAFEDALPLPIRSRPKRGFGLPIEDWLRTGLRPIVHEMLLSPDAKCSAFFMRDRLTTLVSEHESRSRDNGRRLWALLMLESWLQRHEYSTGSAGTCLS